MGELKTYLGSCHCGQVKYEVDLDLSGPVMTCNCSMCGRSGSMLSFVPEKQFRLLSGEDVLRDYQFNKHVIHHLFCGNCGIKSFARGKGKDGAPTVAINVRCLPEVDLSTLKVMQVDGRSR